jgi:hypothetical protein
MRHHTLDFRSLVESVWPETLERYFSSLKTENIPSGWAALNGDALESFLAEPQNAELDAVIRQDLRKVNDLAVKGVAILLDSYNRHDITYDLGSKTEELALRAFLDHREVWDFAWARFLLFALDSKISLYSFPTCSLQFAPACLEGFRSAVSNSFLHQAKGPECEVRAFDLDSDKIIYVQRGNYLRTVTRWQAEAVDVLSYRPALEDVLAYDPETNQLTVKAAQEREREDYVRLFAHHFAGDAALGEQALRSRTFDLSPVASGRFNYQGIGSVIGVQLVGVRLKLPFRNRGTLKIDSANVFETLASLGLSMDVGELVSARFRFDIAEDKLNKRITFEVAPPSRTDLPDNNYTDIINSYLKSQGVRLF